MCNLEVVKDKFKLVSLIFTSFTKHVCFVHIWILNDVDHTAHRQMYNRNPKSESKSSCWIKEILFNFDDLLFWLLFLLLLIVDMLLWLLNRFLGSSYYLTLLTHSQWYVWFVWSIRIQNLMGTAIVWNFLCGQRFLCRQLSGELNVLNGRRRPQLLISLSQMVWRTLSWIGNWFSNEFISFGCWCSSQINIGGVH